MASPQQPGDLSPAAEVFARFLAARDRGESPDFAALCAEHPELAGKLGRLRARFRELDEALGSARAAGPSGAGGAAAAAPSFAFAPGTGDRYEIESEIAHGGMGTVHRVWDRQLRRKLAMKVLHLEELDVETDSSPGTDPRSLSRFLDEAQIMAQLDHPGVVPVHEIGMDAGGRIYFTMSLVRGRSFKEIIDRVHDAGGPGSGDGVEHEWTRTRALGVLSSVCDTVAFAHAKGVVHRDLKPSNVMVGRFGETLVMDWGLARLLDRQDRKDIRLRGAREALSSVRSNRRELAEDEPDSPLMTMDGDVVGTPAYMPPEQARGDVDRVGPRADVYAVGAMLYHLLAGEMPYVPKRTRVSSRTVLAQVLHGPPQPLHAASPRAPDELVAISEKAMARDPDARYADMTELASDLRAFLEQRVVRAWGGGAWAELSMWVRRNRALALTAIAAVLALAVGLVVALVEKTRADRLADEAAAQAQRADGHFKLAFDAVERMLERVGSKRLENVPQAHPVRRDLYRDALQFYETLLADRDDDPELRQNVARTHGLVAGAHRKLGDYERAEAAAEDAVRAYEAVSRADRSDAELNGRLVDAIVTWSTVLGDTGRHDDAELRLREALAQLDRVDPGESLPERTRALWRRARIHASLGVLYAFAKRHDAAHEPLRTAVALTRELVGLESEPVNLRLLATHLDQLGYALIDGRMGPQPEAEAACAEAISIWAGLLEDAPEDEEYRRGHALAVMNLGAAQGRGPNDAATRETHRRAVELFRGLVADYPGVHSHRTRLATSLNNLGNKTADLDQALAVFDEAVRHAERALEIAPDQAQSRDLLSRYHRTILMKLAVNGRHDLIAERVDALPAVDRERADLSRAAAGYLAYAVRFARDDESLSDEDRPAVVDGYVEKAVRHLRDAVAKGWHDPAYLERSHFAPLHGHPKFRAFVDSLER